MLNAPLPKQADLRKLAAKEASFKFELTPAELPRFASALANKQGSIKAELQFYVDEQYRRRVDGKVAADVCVVCQRCLGPVESHLESDIQLAVVWSDDQSASLPAEIDPLVWDEEPYQLLDIVEEELLLALPYVSYHDDMNCIAHLSGDFALNVDDGDIDGNSAAQSQAAKRPNPFDVLAQLKDKPIKP